MQGIIGVYEGCYIHSNSTCNLGGVVGNKKKKGENEQKKKEK